jgi:hypothetical protein
MKWTLRHFYAFPKEVAPLQESLLSPEAWDNVRTKNSGGANAEFYLPTDRTAWLQICETSTASHESAAAIRLLIEREGHARIFSAGVGRACVEYHLKKMLPSVSLTCSEFSQVVVERLRGVFQECDEITYLDLLASWPAIPEGTLVLLNRVDTELSDAQWEIVFARMATAGASAVLVVATGFLTPRTLGWEIVTRFRSSLQGIPLTFAGYVRSKSRFRELWQRSFVTVTECSIGSLTGFLLRRR